MIEANAAKRSIDDVDKPDDNEVKRHRSVVTRSNVYDMVANALKNCPNGWEWESLQQTVCLEPWALGRYSSEVKMDLYCILEPMRPIKIDLFGSAAMNIAFRGKCCIVPN